MAKKHIRISERDHGFWEVDVKEGRSTTVESKIFHRGESRDDNLRDALRWIAGLMIDEKDEDAIG